MLGALPQWCLAATSFLSGPTCCVWCVAGRMSGTDALIIVGERIGFNVVGERIGLSIVGERIGNGRDSSLWLES